MQIPCDLQYIQLNSYYKTNKVKVSAFQSLISFQLRQLWYKFLQYITFFFHFAISSQVQNPKCSFQNADFASLSQSTCWSEAKGLKYLQFLLQTFYLRVKLKLCHYLQNSSQISQFFRGQYYIHWFLSQNPADNLRLNTNLSWNALKHSFTQFCE